MTLELNDPELLKSQAYIDGAWVDADNGETIAVTNPVNGSTIVEIARCGGAETQRAIDAAQLA
jgi:succinate-semialdehyde dehydrogenase/glutarate-semialdehyde dehydrogenase